MGRSFLGDLGMSSTHPCEVQLQPCTTLADYFFVRRLRNQNCHFMTNNPNRISIYQQLKFMWYKPASIRLYVAKMYGKRVGYLLLDFSHTDTTLITEAVDERWRRYGVGSAMIAFAQSHAPHLTAKIKASNTASINLHQRCGFTPIESNVKEVLMFELKGG